MISFSFGKGQSCDPTKKFHFSTVLLVDYDLLRFQLFLFDFVLSDAEKSINHFVYILPSAPSLTRWQGVRLWRRSQGCRKRRTSWLLEQHFWSRSLRSSERHAQAKVEDLNAEKVGLQ